MTERERIEIMAFLRAKGLSEDVIRKAMRAADDEERIEMFRDSSDAKRYQELRNFEPNPGQATLTEVGKVTEGVRYFTDPNPDSEHEKMFKSEFQEQHTGGDIPVYQEDIDMVKKAIPLAKRLLEMQKARGDVGVLIHDAYELPQGPDTTECINEVVDEENIPIDGTTQEHVFTERPLTRKEKAMKGDWQPGVKFPAGAVGKGLVDPGLEYYESTGRQPETPIEKYNILQHMKKLTPEEKEHYKRLFTGIENHGYDRKNHPTREELIRDSGDVMFGVDQGLQGNVDPLMSREFLERYREPIVLGPNPVITPGSDVDDMMYPTTEEMKKLIGEENNKNVTSPGFKAEEKWVPKPGTKGMMKVKPTIFDAILEQMSDVHRRKNADYGDAAYEGYKEFGIQYYIIQLHNKLNRLKSLTKDNSKPQVNESIEDTLLDMANYAVLALEALKRED